MSDKARRLIHNKFFLISIILLLLKIALVYNLPMYGFGEGSARDDYLMVKLASNMLAGQWLGPFDEFTFIKGITYPVFLAINYILHIPSNIANTLLYFLAAAAFVVAISPIIRKTWQKCLLFLVIFYSPISYSIMTFQRIYRDDIYYSLLLLLVSMYIAIYLRKGEYKSIKGYGIACSFVFVLAWFAREDTIWIVPFMVMFSIFIYIQEKSCRKFMLVILAAPYCMLLCALLLLGTINYAVYGTFAINDFQYSSYASAYKLMTQIKTEKHYNKVTLSNEAMEKLYEISPSFRELKDVYEGPVGDMWRGGSRHWNRNAAVPQDEIGASHSMWAFRNAVSEKGYYESPQRADEYYKRLQKEIEEAFANGSLEREQGFRVPLFTSINSDDRAMLFPAIGKTISYVFSYQGIKNDVIMPYILLKDCNFGVGNEKFEKLCRQTAMQDVRGTIGGWLVSDRDNIDMYLENEAGEKLKKAEWESSDDVKAYFDELGMNFINAGKARFTILAYTTEVNKYFLGVYKNGDELLTKIALDHAAGGDMADSGLKWNVERIEYSKPLPQENSQINFKISVLQSLAKIYSEMNKAFIYLSLITYMILTTGIICRYRRLKAFKKLWLVATVLAMVLFMRIFVIAYNTVTAFNSIRYGYLSPCYPMMAGFIGVMAVIVFEWSRNYWGGEKNEEGAL